MIKKDNLVNSMFIGLLIKGISAIIEIIIQILLTNSIGVNEYGKYTFWVSLVEGAFFLLFSGIVKINSYYLSTLSSSIYKFKKKYILCYVFPLICIIISVSLYIKNSLGIIAGIILFVYYFSFDISSVFYSKGLYIPALLGEYFFGRLVLLIAVYAVIKFNIISLTVLLVLYGYQFIVVIFWFATQKRKIINGTKNVTVSISKLTQFQLSDIAYSFISYSPTILQYILGDAFTAGFTGIITIVTKFINFISGPTAKIFLPEFSRLYKCGEKEKLEQSYLMIVRIQMIFISSLGTVLIAFPKLFLKLFSPELEKFSTVFTYVSISLLLIAGIGPVTGFLQMTGNEKICNRNQWLSIIVMIIIWIMCRDNPLFSVYGLAARAIIEGLLKYWSICKWFGKSILSLKKYILMWLPVGAVRFTVELINSQYSFIALIVSVLFVFIWNIGFAVQDSMIKSTLLNIFQAKKV